jgi:tetratricopeptide (TPR) repeat protein
MDTKAVIRRIIKRLKKPKQTDIETSKLLVSEAQLQAKNLEFGAAIETLASAEKLHPYNDKAIALSINYRLKNNTDITEKEVKRYLVRMPDSIYILREAASWFFSNSQYQHAIELQKKLINRQPQVATHYLALSRFFAESGNYDKLLKNNRDAKFLISDFTNSQLILFLKMSLCCGDFDSFWGDIELIAGADLTANEKVSLSKVMHLCMKILNGDLNNGFHESLSSIESRVLAGESFPSAFNEYFGSKLYDRIRDYPSVSHSERKVNSNNLLFVSDNWNFLSDLILGLEQYNISVRTLNSTYVTGKLCLASQFFGSLVARESDELPVYTLPENTITSDLLHWADTIFIEWCNNSAFWLSWVHGLDKKIVLRVHSYEAFSIWPAVINWNAISTIIFVSEHIKGIFEDRYLKPSGFNDSIEKTVLPNINNLSDYMSDNQLKVAVAEEVNICMVGYANANKNPIFSLMLVDQLVDVGVPVRLYLIGSFWRGSLSEAEESYKSRFDDVVARLSLSDRVVYIDFTDDLSAVFQSMHFIVSASEREGTHESIIQAMAAGVVPIIRDWPVVKPWGGASTLYGDKWLVNDVSSAIDLVNRATVSQEVYNGYAMEVVEYTCAHFDSTYVLPKYRELLS